MTLKERIRQRAYEMWEEAGRPAGKAEEYWEMARAEVAAEDAAADEDPRHA